MTQKQAERLSDEYRDMVLARTGLKPEQLVCPREKSDMTPCVARDGGLAVYLNTSDHPCCVGCASSVELLMTKELAKQSTTEHRVEE